MSKLIDDVLFNKKTLAPNGKIVQEMLDSIKDGKIAIPRESAEDLYSRWNSEVMILRENLNKTIVILADNVCEYVFAHTGKLSWSVVKDFPCLSPPFDNFWIEMNRPSSFLLETANGGSERISSKEFSLKKWAFHFLCAPLAEADKLFEDGLRVKIFEAWQGILADISIVMKLDYYWESDSVKGPLDSCYIAIDRMGKGLHEPIATRKGEILPSGDDMERFSIWHLPPALLAISFLHCKNVIVTDNDPPAKLQKARQRRGQKPLLRFKTLNIEPIARILKHEGGSEKTGLKKALHICRGHFSTYTSERPLFGRVAGTFWIPSHIRGNKNEGEVIKEYQIGVPKDGGI